MLGGWNVKNEAIICHEILMMVPHAARSPLHVNCEHNGDDVILQ